VPDQPSTPPAPDWAALADGKVHRLRAGHDYAGDTRAQIRAARAAAEQLGRHAILARDELGEAAFLWVQFVDGVVVQGASCPACDGMSLGQLGPRVARCEDCGSVYELRGRPPLQEGTPDTRRAALEAQRALGRDELLRDEGFADTLARVVEARATRMAPRRLWTLWEAAGGAAATGGAGAAIGSTWAAGAAFLAAALSRRSGELRPCVVVDHPWYRRHADTLEDGQLADALALLTDLGAIVVEGDMEDASATLGMHRYGVVHLDLRARDEVADALRHLHPYVLPRGVIVVEAYRLPAAGRSAPVAEGVEDFMADEPGYTPWRTSTRQIVLIKGAA
jgi:hypothetical protein